MAIKTYVYPKLAAQVSTSGLATEIKQDTIIQELVDANLELDSQTQELIDANLELVDVNLELDNITSELQTLNAVDFATSAKQDTAQQKLEDLEVELQTLNAVDFATDTELQAVNSNLQDLKQAANATLFTLPFDTIQVVSKTANGPTSIVSKLSGTIVQTITITYDIDGDFVSAAVS